MSLIGRKWCFTLNNYTEQEVQKIKEKDEKVQYLIAGKEVGESGTPHLQGYIQFKANQRLSGVKKIVGERAHIEKQKAGDNNAARDYCIKDGDYFEWGSFVAGQGQRNDILSAVETMRKRGYEALGEDHPVAVIKYHKGLKELNQLWQSNRTKEPYVIWLWGTSGIGKSKFAMDLSDKLSVWFHSGNPQWFPGYRNQDVAVFDDFNESDKFPYRFLLRLLDRYPMQVPDKGTYYQWNSSVVIITSEYHPSVIYNTEYTNGENGAYQLNRRINWIGTKNAEAEPFIFTNPSSGEEAAEAQVQGEIYDHAISYSKKDDNQDAVL